MIDEIKRIILDSEITKEDDHNWPAPDKVGRQELEVKLGNDHISFTVSNDLSRVMVAFCYVLCLLIVCQDWISFECARKQ